MRLLREFSRRIAVDADRAFAALRQAYVEDEYTMVALDDGASRRLHVEGQGWYHGEVDVAPDGDGCIATLRVFSKAQGVGRLLWWMPERQGLRFARRQFEAAIRQASSGHG